MQASKHSTQTLWVSNSDFDNLLTEIGSAVVFTLADIKFAFWHVPLDEASSLLTTFNTPIGVLTSKGVKPDSKKQGCIQSIPATTNKEEKQRALGFVTPLSRFSENLSTKSEPRRALLKKDTVFFWEANEHKAFEEIKKLISNAQMLKNFNPT